MNTTLLEIANLVGGTISAEKERSVSGISPIDSIKAETIVYAEGSENIAIAEASEAVAILTSKNVEKSNKPLIQVTNTMQAFIKLLEHFNPARKATIGVHPSAVLAPDLRIGQNVSIGPFVIIEEGSTIGDNSVIHSHVHIGSQVTIGQDCQIYPQVTIYDNCKIGDRVSIHASTVIGSDGFGYNFDNGKHIKIPHVGNVIIENDVEIGANTVIDRATLGSTVIGEGTKIDNLVQIAHSVKLGKHNILCAFTGIAGSTTSGDQVIFAANVGVSDHVKIDDGVILGARAGVPPRKHLKQGNIYLGSPARPKEKAIELELSTSRIPIMRKNIKALSERVDKLTERLTLKEME